MAASFVHLRLHTEYSLNDSVVRVDELVKATAEAGMPALAVTDNSNLFAMVKLYKTALGKGLKPLIGVDLWVKEVGERATPSRLVLLCQTPLGYKNVTTLVTDAYLKGQQKGVPMIDRAWLTPESVAGVVALSGAQEGDIGRALLAERERDAQAALDQWRSLFGDRFYIELQRLGRPDEERYIDAAVALSVKAGVPLVATNDVRFLKREDFEAHEARVCIHDGTQLADPSRPRRYTEQQYLRTPEEMAELFKDLPEALENTVQIAQRCSLTLKLGQPRLPPYPVPGTLSTEDYLKQTAREGLDARLATDPRLDVPRYQARLTTELDVICKMGFAGYFLIVADFIRWSRNNGVPVGPGRGSGAGSLVAYSIGITDIDPIAYDLLFERFLNPERVSMPDFDVDFCMDGRDRVIEYVAQKYGRDRVSQIITYGTMAAKAVVRDVGRVLGMSYGYVDRIAKLIPFELGITLDDALTKEPELQKLYDTEEEVKGLIDLARSLEGITRNAGMHAGGVVISPSVLTDFAPLYCDDQGGSLVTQFDKDDVEAAGLVKFDFLGLRTLTIIASAMVHINRARAAKGEAPLTPEKLPMGDPRTYSLLKSYRTTAVFQLESRGMKDLIRRLQPDCFEDIVALVALFRPGPLESGMVGDFIDRKHGNIDGPIDYLHPSLEPVLKPTYGVILYQEQVMQIAQVLAGYTLGGADMLRRAMGKKKPEEMAKQRSIFLEGSVKRNIDEKVAAHIFDLMEKFAGYGFNKSHSAAYALLSYQTAYLKAHYPAAFMAAVLSADMDHTDKVVPLIQECADIGLTVLPPDVNASDHAFAVANERTIRYGLGAVRGVGQNAVEAILGERQKNGRFKSLEDLCRRIDLSKVNRRLMEALLRSGSLDSLGENRATLMDRLPAALQLGDQTAKASQAGQNDLFGLSAGPAEAPPEVMPPPKPEWSEAVRLTGERETLGLYLTGHPIGRFEPSLPQLVTHRIGDLLSTDKPSGDVPRFGGGRQVTVAGLIDEVKKKGTRTIVVLDDRTGRIEASLFDDVALRYKDLLVKDALVLVEAQLRFDEFSDAWRLSAKRVSDLERLREAQARHMLLVWPKQAGPDRLGALHKLEQVLLPWKGGPCAITVQYTIPSGATGKVNLGREWSVRATRELLDSLEPLVGREGIQVFYGGSGAERELEQARH